MNERIDEEVHMTNDATRSLWTTIETFSSRKNETDKGVIWERLREHRDNIEVRATSDAVGNLWTAT